MNLDFIGVEKCELCGRNSAQISVENLERISRKYRFKCKRWKGKT